MESEIIMLLLGMIEGWPCHQGKLSPTPRPIQLGLLGVAYLGVCHVRAFRPGDPNPLFWYTSSLTRSGEAIKSQLTVSGHGFRADGIDVSNATAL